MWQGVKISTIIAVCLISILSLSGCAGRNYLIVDYQVPASTSQLDGQTVRLQIEDRRESKTVLSPEAAYEFPEFNGTYSLAWVVSDRERVLAGEHHLEPLFKMTFTKRLTAMGIRVIDSSDTAVPLLMIQLKHFKIDLQNHKWQAQMDYDAVLTAEGRPTSRQNVRGSAERVRIIGRKGADTVLSDIFSDVVNRLDLIKLFEGAELVR